MKPLLLRTLVCTVLLGSSAFGTIVFQDDFSGGADPSWVTDRYRPPTVTTVMFEGNERLLIGTDQSATPDNRPSGQSGTFYNTQGIKTPGVATTGEYWTMTVDVYVTNDMLDGDGLQQFGMWGYTGTGYPIINFASHDPLDAFNPDSAGIVPMLRTYNTTTGAWNMFNALDYLTANTWATLEIRGTNQGFDYFVNGVQLGGTDLNVGALNLQEGFLQTYNYGQPHPNPFDPVEPTSVMFDNFTVQTIPEPAAAALGGIGLLGLLRRRRA